MSEPTVKDQLVSDHAELYDTLVARSYFAKFDRITGHLARIAWARAGFSNVGAW